MGTGRTTEELAKIFRFHSINVPSEWGPNAKAIEKAAEVLEVSIQLMSPASGDFEHNGKLYFPECETVSIQLMSPASGD